jgi:hypothetical protein
MENLHPRSLHFLSEPLNRLEDLALSQNQNVSQHTAAAGSNLKIGYGWRQGDDAFVVGQQAAGDAVQDLEVGLLTAVLVFASVRYDLKQVLQGIQKVAGEAPVLGATTAGEICNVPRKGKGATHFGWPQLFVPLPSTQPRRGSSILGCHAHRYGIYGGYF